MKTLLGYISVILIMFLCTMCTDDALENRIYESGTIDEGVVTFFDTVVNKDTIDWSRFPIGPHTFYASPDGSQMNSGKHPDSAWTLGYGASLIGAGDTLWVGKGNYGSLNIGMNQSGTADKPVHILGYKDYPGDLDMPNEPAKPKYDINQYALWDTQRYSVGNAIPTNGPAIINDYIGIGVGIRVNGSNVKIENLQIEGYSANLIGFGTNNIFKHIVSLKSQLITEEFVQGSGFTNMLLGSGIGVSTNDSFIINSIVLTDNECGPMSMVYLANNKGIGSAFLLFFRSGGPCPSM